MSTQELEMLEALLIKFRCMIENQWQDSISNPSTTALAVKWSDVYLLEIDEIGWIQRFVHKKLIESKHE